jgi:hypothetical protein
VNPTAITQCKKCRGEIVLITTNYGTTKKFYLCKQCGCTEKVSKSNFLNMIK